VPQSNFNNNNYSNYNSRNGSLASLASVEEDPMSVLRRLDVDRTGSVTGMFFPLIKSQNLSFFTHEFYFYLENGKILGYI
jgi:hypothetical protein